MTRLNNYIIKDEMRICSFCRLEFSKKQSHSNAESSTIINDKPLAENISRKPDYSKDDTEYIDI